MPAPAYLMAFLVSFSMSLWATPNSETKLFTNQDYLETVRKKEPLSIHSTEDVFQFVFNHLPNEVTVYPTENYYNNWRHSFLLRSTFF